MMKRKKLIVSAIALFILLFVADYLADQSIESDVFLPNVTEFVQTDLQINARFGEIETIEVRRISRVSAAPTSAPFSLYTLHVMGDKDDGLVEIKVTFDSDTSEIESIRLGR